MRQSHLTIRLLSFKLPSTISGLTAHSVEVNIGIIAASLPTLLPLYRLLRDKVIAVRANSTSITGRFQWLGFGQRREAEVASQSAGPETHEDKVMGGTRSSQWANSTIGAFARIGNADGEDVEMHGGVAGSR